ncbi:MAG TPA: endonuclease MutS2, partial [Candidatus Izemoplasmatales bacterium]|nr:endonuclease MutS2 [Candidatus Izemoplasmatales bacterium]
QAKVMILRLDETPLTGVLDIQSVIKKAEIESILTVEEFMKIVSHQEAIQRTNQYIKKIDLLEIDYDGVKSYYDRLVNLSSLKKDIDRIIDPKGEIYDKASPKLGQLRRKIKVSEEKINQQMAALLKSEANKLSDSIITIRNNRLVLPVKSEYKNSFNGVVHDQSASKETVFMEPMSSFKLNNELQSLRLDEENEIEAILRKLTAEVSEHTESLTNNLNIFTYLDIVFAKAKYAIAYDMHRPELTKQIKLINARHPLIEPDEVVGNNVIFGGYRHIIITGPNTGGKTVALKTLGLLSLMVQSGMLIPVNEHSETIVFNHIFADIGDEQSIEQSLSTFSSHISNIIRIFNHIEDNALVLLDEIGSGTDPKEGASLAISMMDFIRKHHIYSMVTTHYPELKTYAYNLDDIINASVEFDLQTLKPTYKLKIGIPGESNAISIARRLGLDGSICKQAEDVSISFDTDVTKLVRKLEKQSHALDEQIKKEEIQLKEIDEMKISLDLLKEKHIQEHNRVLKTYAEENQLKQEEALKKVDALIEELDALRSKAQFKEHKLAEVKHERSQLTQNDPISYEKSSDKSINPGDRVKILTYQRQGIVNKALKSNEFEVQMGVLTVTAKEDDLEYMGKPKKKAQIIKSKPMPKKNVKVELDLHGKRYVEAMDELDKFVDDCLLNNLEFAYIVHGIGTMALKKGVEKYAKKNPQIKSFRPGGEREGGKGVTILYFK